MSNTEHLERFVRRYGETWQAWDAPGFLSLFDEQIVYAVHPDEVVRGLEELARACRSRFRPGATRAGC